jgi:hypothetical protein
LKEVARDVLNIEDGNKLTKDAICEEERTSYQVFEVSLVLNQIFDTGIGFLSLQLFTERGLVTESRDYHVDHFLRVLNSVIGTNLLKTGF